MRVEKQRVPLLSLAGAGHFLQLERPERFAAAIEAFLGLRTPVPSAVQLRGIASATS